MNKNRRAGEGMTKETAVPEATLEDLLQDPVTHIMMNRDGVTAEDIRNLIETMRHRMFEPMAADD
jgi:hypothetical protein